MFLGYVVDEFLDEHGLAHACAAEETDFSALEIRFQQVYDLYAGEKHFLGGLEVFEFRGFAVDREAAARLELSKSVNGISGNIEDTAPDAGSHRHFDRVTGTYRFHASAKSVSGIHSHAAYGIFSNMLLYLNY